MGALRQLLSGNVPLNDAFWHWAVAGGIAVNLLTSLFSLILLTRDLPVAALIVGYGPAVPYNIAVLIGVWRSAARYEGDPGWGRAARLVTLFLMIGFSVT